MSGEEDPTREIFGYTAHLPVPVWVDKNAYSGCHHCKVKFSAFSEATKPHHCRLCGHMLCGSCTGKYHVPLVYEQKGKKGPTRVCISCRDSCLAQKEREKNAALALQPHRHAVLSSVDLKAPLGTAATRPSQFAIPGQQIEIAPPVWDDMDKYVECAKCHKKGGKPHNCRTCGHLYCDDCTSKMVIPAFFEKKKKVGPARVCGECRFKILGGAKLVERLSTDLPELDGASGGGDGGSRAGSATACIASGCTLSRVSKTGYCAAHLNEHGGGDTGDLSASASISIRWEGESHLLAKVALTDRAMNLLQIDDALRKLLPSLRERDDYEYLYRSEGINEVFYDIFTAATFAPQGNNLYIRKKVDTDLLVAAYARQGPSGAGRATASRSGGGGAGAGGGGVDAVPTSNNPFKASRREEEKKIQPAKRIERKVATPIFRKPTGTKPFQRPGGGATPGPKKVPPPPPPPSGGGSRPPPPPLPANAGAGVAGPDVFKQRAKKYFGAL